MLLKALHLPAVANDGPIITRFAPTPSGLLHLGNLYNFLLIDELVKEKKGLVYLRIDDTDQLRAKDEYLDDIIKTFDWFELDYKSIIYASEYRELYLEKLKDLPVYACDCSRSDIKKRGGDASYDGYCRNRKITHKTGKTNLRLLNETSRDDIVIWQKNDGPSYHFSSVVLDQHFKINTIIRGEDLRESSSAQAKLSTFLNYNFPTAANLIHHPLLLNEKNQKLSKSQ